MMKAYESFLKSMSEMKVYDISPTFETNMPGMYTHPSLGIVKDARNFDQNGYFAQTLVMSEHTGSHVDAPGHFLPSLDTIDKFPADTLIGAYKKYDLTPYKPQAGKLFSLSDIKEIEDKEGFKLNKGDVVLLQFGWDKYYKPNSNDPVEREWWGKNEPGLTEDACQYFYESGIRAIGSDTAGCDIGLVNGEMTSGFGHEKYFLPNNILIMEGFVNMDKAPNEGIFLAIPLKIKEGSGSPIRPMLLA